MSGTSLVDLSHTVEHGMVTYKGLPAPLICDFLTREASRSLYAEGTEFHIGRIDMVANTGTYVDSPFHRYADGKDLAQLPLESLAHLDAVVVRYEGLAIPAAAFDGVDLRGRAVLVHTGWDRHWRTDAYYQGHPHLTRDAAVCLAEAGAALGASTRIILTTSTTVRALCIRFCSPLKFPSASICATWPHCPGKGSASPPYR